MYALGTTLCVLFTATTACWILRTSPVQPPCVIQRLRGALLTVKICHDTLEVYVNNSTLAKYNRAEANALVKWLEACDPQHVVPPAQCKLIEINNRNGCSQYSQFVGGTRMMFGPSGEFEYLVLDGFHLYFDTSMHFISFVLDTWK
jgi:hypothetical protein